MKSKKCKVCKDQFIPQRPLQQVCSGLCAYKYQQEQKQKAWKKEKKVIKEKLMTKSDYLKLAQTVFNTYIRLRDKDLPCISCGTITGQQQAGHYRSVGSAPHLRFNENNVHKQCATCNNWLSGNLLQYRPNLIKKIGLKAVEELEYNNDNLKLSIEEIKEITKKYKEKIKSLK